LTEIERNSGTKNATILVVVAGVLLAYLGYQYTQIPTVISDPFLTMIGLFILVLGAITLGTSLTIWFQKPWAAKLVTGVGTAVCVCLVVFGYYLMLGLFGPIFWVAINQLRKTDETNERYNDSTKE